MSIQTKLERRRSLTHDLRHLSGRHRHEVIQIGDDAAEEIASLRLALMATRAGSPSAS